VKANTLLSQEPRSLHTSRVIHTIMIRRGGLMGERDMFANGEKKFGAPHFYFVFAE